MEIIESRTDLYRNKLAEVLVNIPQMSDILDAPELCRLRCVSKDVKDAVDQPIVWRVQFAKKLKVAPCTLPRPLLSDRTNPFKDFCEGIDIARHCAATGDKPNRNQSVAMTATENYLRQHFPEVDKKLSLIVESLKAWQSAKDSYRGCLPLKLAALCCNMTASVIPTLFFVRSFMKCQSQRDRHGALPSSTSDTVIISGPFALFIYSFSIAGAVFGAAFGLYSAQLAVHSVGRVYDWDNNMRRWKSEELVPDER
jgi:hypothetical protein